MRYKTPHSKVKDRSNMGKIDIENFIGRKNNLLTVIGIYSPENGGRAKLKCLCDCGKETYVFPYQFNNGSIKSCGCARVGNGVGVSWCKKHGLSHDSTYKEWIQIKSRCYNKNHHKYPRYGGRGIVMCDEWLNSPLEFAKWMNETKPKDGYYTIDRIDNDGPYSPENCKWSTRKEQQRNTSQNRILEFNGESHCMSEWAEIMGINYKLLSNRISKGWSIERALTEPVNKKHSHKKLDKPKETN